MRFKHFLLALISASLLLSSCSSPVINVAKETMVQVEKDDEFANDEVPDPIHFVYKNSFGAA